MSTADFVFIESKDPIFLDLQDLCTALREKFPGIIVRERTKSSIMKLATQPS